LRTTSALAFVLVAVLLAGSTACLDFTPITEVPASDASATEDDAATPSASDDGGASVDAVQTCMACIGASAGDAGASSDGAPAPSASSPPAAMCAVETAACEATDKCMALFTCGVPRGCYSAGADLVACLTTCGQGAGLTSASDPAVAPFIRLYNCASAKCAGPCGGPHPG
jgi:hypothetical protein